MNAAGGILVAEIGGTRWFRVCGRGTFHNSGGLKAVALDAIADGAASLVIDLEHCPMVDSTFMGVLTALAIQLEGAGKPGAVEVLNANPRNISLLEGLGLDHILAIDHDGTRWSDERQAISTAWDALDPEELTRTGKAELVLDAHRALGEANDENVARFRDVISCVEAELAEDLRQAEDEGESGEDRPGGIA